jgi:inner membrane protein
MDTLTHALSGALLARATWRKGHQLSLRQRTAVGFFTAAFPDIDYILRLTTDNFIVYLNYHRGVTHSVLLLPLWALLLAFIFSRLLKNNPDWRSLYIICCLGLGIHIAGDVITSYGTMIFAPFTAWRASLDTTFIIDPFFSAIIITALVFSYTHNNRPRIAAIGLVVLASYLGLQAWAHKEAIHIGEQTANKNRWRETTISAIPQPLSPFHWKVIVEHKEHYHVALLRLLGDDFNATPGDGFLVRLYAAYHSPSTIDWIREDRYGYDRYKARQIKRAWQSEVMSDFRRFSRFPALTMKNNPSGLCHSFSDLRFVIPGRKNFNLFTYQVCREITPGSNHLQPETRYQDKQ